MSDVEDPEANGMRPSIPSTYWLPPEHAALADRVIPLDRFGCFHVASFSEEGIFHMVEMDPRTGITTCDCTAAFYGATCRHRRAVHYYLTRLLGKPV